MEMDGSGWDGHSYCCCRTGDDHDDHDDGNRDGDDHDDDDD